jgi:hypothetical protein
MSLRELPYFFMTTTQNTSPFPFWLSHDYIAARQEEEKEEKLNKRDNARFHHSFMRTEPS